jgi:transcriptional regulator with XRE-family HTH domain
MDILQLASDFRAARINRRLTQQDVAGGAGVSVVTVSRFERGELLEIGTVKLLNLFKLVGLELYPRPLGHVRTLDDIQRQRTLASVAGSVRPNITLGGSASTSVHKSSPGKIIPRDRNNIDVDTEPRKNQRVRHSKAEKNHG